MVVHLVLVVYSLEYLVTMPYALHALEQARAHPTGLCVCNLCGFAPPVTYANSQVISQVLQMWGWSAEWRLIEEG